MATEFEKWNANGNPYKRDHPVPSQDLAAKIELALAMYGVAYVTVFYNRTYEYPFYGSTVHGDRKSADWELKGWWRDCHRKVPPLYRLKIKPSNRKIFE